MAGSGSLVFKTRVLAQAHPLSPEAHRYVNRVVARERSTRPQEEMGDWAGNGLTIGYCLRRIEEVEVLGVGSETGTLEVNRVDELTSGVASAMRSSAFQANYLLAEETIVSTLDDLIRGEIERRLDHLKETVSEETWGELEEYIAWWVIKGYALRVVETDT